MGATTIWERWDGIKPDSTFQTAGMNSFNHYAYGAIGDWMYRVVAGLDTDEDMPGYKKIKIKPHIGGKLTHAAATLNTYYGKAHSGWKLDNGKLILEVEVPANTTAEVYIPATNASSVTENGLALTSLKDIQVIGTGKEYVQVVIGSGSYRFEVANNK
jgi:alpha-L-rhamnosidase